MSKRSKGEGTIFFSKSQGLWVAEISLPDGKRKRKYSKAQKTVREWLLAQREALRDGLLLEDDRVTVSEFVDRYMDQVAIHTLRPKTLESYESLVRIHIKPSIGFHRLSALSPAHLQKLYSDKLNSGLSKRTVQFIHSIIHKILDQAMKWGLVIRNVADLVDAPSPKRKAPNVWTAEQVKTFLNHVKGHRWYLIYVLAIYCGFREGEILGIHYDDIDLKHGVINVRHAVQYLKGKGLVITEPKTDRARRAVTVPDFAINVIKHHLESQYINQGIIFKTSNKTPISPRNLVRHFKASLKEAGVPEIRFHDLRHTSATLLLSAGVHPKVVQERLGHSSVVLTLTTYSHVLPGIQEEAAIKLEAFIENTK
jgi:integrase